MRGALVGVPVWVWTAVICSVSSAFCAGRGPGVLMWREEKAARETCSSSHARLTL
ncbi:hypothetical protein [Streptomyces sp. NPDC007205]|uniref:hypothetical protein n=1 Tax=Streptomyces sp. NPDC007205 TaxID=3154316 RepID=UPI0034040B1B